jgi:small subunit ribosomal protein S6e
MAEFKLTIGNPKNGKSYKREVKDQEAKGFIGKKIGDTIKGDLFSMPGFEFTITGGSDYCGFPMRKDVLGTGRKKILAVGGVGLKKKAKGIRQRKTVCGNTIHDKISQINLLVTVEGKTPLEPEGEKKADEKKEHAEAPKKAK